MQPSPPVVKEEGVVIGYSLLKNTNLPEKKQENTKITILYFLQKEQKEPKKNFERLDKKQILQSKKT